MSDDQNDTAPASTAGSEIAFVRELAEVLRAQDLDEIEIKRGVAEGWTFSVRMSRASTVVAAPAPVAPVSVPAAAPVPASTEPAVTEDPANLPGAVTSPMVGTAYLAPEPGAAAFVSVGDRVSEGQTLLIVEAMKTMNQIPAPAGGVVRRILIEDGSPVEYGAPLMVIE